MCVRLLLILLLWGITLPAQAGSLDLINSLKPGEWFEIPGSKMSSVVPCPARNCPYSGVEGPGAVIWSWSGGVYDTFRDRLVVWGGGHGAYAGNEIYAFDMTTLRWSRITDPSSIAGYSDGQLTYPDGNPVSVHSYDQIEYDPAADRMFVFGGSRYSNGSSSTAAFTFDFDAKQWTQAASIPGDPYTETLGFSLNSAYDPVTKLVYIGGAWSLTTYNVATNTWQLLSKDYGGWQLPNGLTAALDSKRRQFLQIGRGHAFIWDISVLVPQRADLVTSGAKEIEECDAPGLDYDPVSDRIVAWCAGADIYTLNLDTKTWTKVTATNTVTPGDPHHADYHGTFGRFRYVPSMNLFVVVTDMDTSVFVYKLTDSAGRGPAPGRAHDDATLSATSGGAIGIEFALLMLVALWRRLFTFYRALFCIILVAVSGCKQGGEAESVTAPTQYPTPTGNGLTMPSVADEAAAYRKWGWTWDPAVEPAAVSEPITPYAIVNPDIHGNTEGDDLWTYLMMYRRSENPVYLARATAWARYFKEDYRPGIGNDDYTLTFDGSQYEYDHMYGWGLVTWYEHTALAGSPDYAALAEAEKLAEVVETFWNKTNSDGSPRYVAGQMAMAYYGQRRGARHLLLATRVAEATQNPRWISLRNKLIELWLKSPDWEWTDAGKTTGMYYYGAWDTNESVAPSSNCKYTDAPDCPYQRGDRIISPFQIGILTEAFDQAYRATGNPALVDRMVALARFADQYGLDPIYDYTASRLGFVNGQLWHNYSSNGPTTWWDPVYTTSLVNTLVRGYKYTGDRRFYDRALHFFNRGTKGVYGSITPVIGDNVAHHFVDTRFDSSTGNYYLAYNKGELQYTYLLFENGGLASP